MDIRLLKQQELIPALQLTWDVFVADVVPSYSTEGVEEFQKFIRFENIAQMHRNKELIFFGAFEKNEILGVIAGKKDGHITLFFVKKDMQGHGIGKMLFHTYCDYCFKVYGVSKITVNAAPDSVEKYLHLGMYKTGEEEVRSGIRSVPLEMNLLTSNRYQKPKKTSKGAIIAAVAVGILLLLAVIFGAITLIRNLYDEFVYTETEEIWEYPEDGSDDWSEYIMPYDEGMDGSSENGTEELSGIDAIEAYIDEDISYEISEEIYTAPEQETQNPYIEFQVKYPQLNGLDTKAAEEINETIKECALKTVDEIYENPSQEIKEKVLSADTPVLVSYVEYKVCYANDDFISIVFQDESYQGTTTDYHCNLRTLNISLEDGNVYEVKDIVKVDKKFVKEWLEVMRSETGDSEFLSELSEKEMMKALKGDSLDGEYVANFFVADGKIEIGFDLNYSDDSSANSQYAWVTAPFELNKIHKYASDSSFWDDL